MQKYAAFLQKFVLLRIPWRNFCTILTYEHRHHTMIHIRPAAPRDADVVYQFICALENHTFEQAAFHSMYVENCQHPRHIYLVAELDAHVIGCINCHMQPLLHHGGTIAEIQEMFVAPEHRGNNVGQKLLNALLAALKQKKVLQVEVCSALWRTDAHRFYEREGFTKTSYKLVQEL